MPRATNNVAAHARTKKVLAATKGHKGSTLALETKRDRIAHEGDAVRDTRPQEPQARVPSALDRAHQCRGAPARYAV